jgi:serpin B
MCIFLPDADDGLQGLLNTITSRPGFLHDHLPKWRVDVREVRVPKFKLSFYTSVVTVLRKLGLELPFSVHADLSDMVEDDGSGLPILVDDVTHKAVIEVNEEGTEAAAVTMVVDGIGCAMPPPPPPPPQLDFVADHPFAFYIVEEATGAVVFAGHVLDPSKEE